MEGVVVFDACAANGVVASSFSNSSRDAMNIISTVKGTAVLSKDWKELFSSQTLSFYPYGKKDGKVYSTAPRDTGGADDCVGEIIVTGPTEIETCSGEVVLEIIGEVEHEVPSRSMRVAAGGVADLMDKLKPKEKWGKKKDKDMGESNGSKDVVSTPLQWQCLCGMLGDSMIP
ncbi:hypothetical protein V6N13_106776 [Hibiscus sabdariffa]